MEAVVAGATAAEADVPNGFETVAVELAAAVAAEFVAVVFGPGVVDAVNVDVVLVEPAASGSETVAEAGAIVVVESACVEAGGVTVPESTFVVMFGAPVELGDAAGVADCAAATVSTVFATAAEGGAVVVGAEVGPCALKVEGLAVTMVAEAVFCAGAAGIEEVAGAALKGAL